MTVEEFTIESMPDYRFRTVKASPVDLLAITTQMNMDSFVKSKTFYTFVLEHIEVLMGEKWLKVKYPGQEVYMPTAIEDDLRSCNALVEYFLEHVILKAFPESSE